MPVQIGKAGAGAREMAKRRTTRVYGLLLIFLVVSGFLSLAGNKLLHFNSYFLNLFGWLAVGLSAGLLIVVYRALLDPKREIDVRIDQALYGARAEESISEILDGLSKEYAVFNDFPCPMGNIDHIVVGPTGLFVIETKSHSGEITLSPEGELLRDGKPLEKDFLKQVLGQCFWLKEKLAGRGIKVPYINAVVAFTRAFVKVYQPVKGVQIVNRKWLLKCITEAKNRLSEDERHQVFWHILAIKSEEGKMAR